MSFKPESDKPSPLGGNTGTAKTSPFNGGTPPFVGESSMPDASSLMKAAAAVAGQTALAKAGPAVTGALAAGTAIAGMMNEMPEMPADVQDIMDAITGGGDSADGGGGGGGSGGGGTRTVNASGAAVPAGMLTFASMSGQETLSELFSYTVQLKTPDKLNMGYFAPSSNLPLKPMVGKDISVDIELEGGGKRYISGLVTAARVVGHQGRGVAYELRIEPWLELATRTSDYKIFQNKSVVDILDEVLGEYPFEMEKRLTETYPKRNFQVQYGETDYDFLQRLMQEFGIYYFFEHSAGSHKLVLVDAIGSHTPCPGAASVSFHQQGLKLDKEFIHTIAAKETLRTGKWVLDDFDFKKPKAKLTSTVAKPRETGHPDYEHYEWPGDYFDKSEGEFLTKVRMEAQKSLGNRVHGSGNVRTIATGCTFSLDNCPTVEANREYLIVDSAFMIQDIGEHSSQGQHFEYSTSFELLPTSEVFRPQRTIKKPHTRGPQSAIVVGPPGEEIWTDEYGRIKLQFLWDRYGEWNENSSCWIRVSQPWAGKGFGGIQIPRIGQEVIVDFKNGDPDLPLVTGRVYNADTMPPWGLPANKTQSGMFSRSMKGGPSNGNALRFEDKESGEQVWFHAEKDLDTNVNNNETHIVGKDRSKTIGKNETLIVGKDRTKTVGKDEKTTIVGNRTENVTGAHTEVIKKDMTVVVQEAAQTTTVKKDITITSTDGNIALVAAKGKVLVQAAESITLSVGKSSIVMDKDGNVVVLGPTLILLNKD